jgi:hypothetical protein
MLTSWIVLVLECKCNKNYRWKLCDYEIKERRLRYEEKFNEMKKKCPLIIKPDLYTVSQYLILIAFILFCIYICKKDQSYAKASFLTFVAGAVCLPVQFCFGKAKVSNKSGDDIEYIKEGGGKNRSSYTLNDGKGLHDIDGIRFNGTAYKIPDGVHVTVNDKGKIIPHSVVGKVIYHVEGGVIDNPLDSSWNALFPKEKWV